MDSTDVETMDKYSRAAWEDLRQVFGGAVEDVLRTHAGVVLRPDAIVGRRIGPALEYLRQEDFVPVASVPFLFSREIIRELWRRPPFFSTSQIALLSDRFMPSAPSLLVVVRKSSSPNAVEELNRYKGTGKLALRRSEQLRTRLGAPYALIGFVHSADTIPDFVHELGIFCTRSERLALLRDVQRDVDETDAIHAYADRVYEEYPAHDLCLERSLRRIQSACASCHDDPIAAHCHLLLTGESRDWEHLLALIEHGDHAIDLWDQVTVGAAFFSGGE